MRIALVRRDLSADDVTGTAAAVLAAAATLSGAGHDVNLVCEHPPPPGSVPAALRRVAPGPSRPGHRYCWAGHDYADRVYDTLRAMHETGGLDAAEFSDAGGEALTTLRARRLLGDLAGTTIGVTLEPWSAPSGRAGVETALIAFAERYSREHADVVIACSEAAASAAGPLGGRLRMRRPAPPPAVPDRAAARPPDPPAARTVVRFGDLRDGAGLVTFLDAAERVLEREPRWRFVLLGRDTGTDPGGGSYWRHLCRRLSERLRAALVLAGPATRSGLASLPAPGCRCVLPEALAESPATALLALAMGYSVVAPRASSAADGLPPGAGTLVPPGDPAALAAALLAAPEGPPPPATAAAGAAALLAPYEGGRTRRRPARPAARHLVSVVVPLYDQGQYLDEALDSVRASEHRDVEIVVVDDGSTDPATIRAFDRLRGVTKVRQPNRGLPAARNVGFAACAGDYIVTLDADDMLPRAFIGRALAALLRSERLGCVAGTVRNCGLFDDVYVPPGHVPGLSLVVNTYARGTALFRRAAVEQAGGYDEALPAFEDWDLYIRLHAAGWDSDILPIEGQVYRRHRDSMAFGVTDEMRLGLLQHLLRKHAALLGPSELTPLLLALVQMWRTGYEPSASAQLLRRLDPFPPAPGA
jgi:glycosyltransferase involved in cell wall biosynthesis